MLGNGKKKTVLAKIFLNPIQGWLQFQRSIQGTRTLLTNAIPTPTILHAGKLKHFQAFVILFDFIDGPALDTAFEQAIFFFERWILLRQLVELLAKQHQAGIKQKNLHLKNFLHTNNTLYCVDTNRIRQHNKPISTKKSLKLLASALGQFSKLDSSLKSKAIAHYFKKRGWLETTEQLNYLSQQNAYWQKKRENTLRAKLFRTSTHFASEKNRERFWIIDRHYLTDEFLTFIKTPEYFFESRQMHILKTDQTTTVGVIQIGDDWFLVKRYNMRNFWYSVKRSITKTRAAKSWENAHRLLFRGIRTAKPIAMIENRWGLFKGVSYFISAYIPAMTATEYFKPHQLDQTEGKTVAQKISTLLQKLRKEKIYHGDLKATNILINDEGVWLIDLDAMRFYQSSLFFTRRAAKDKARFERNWQGQPIIKRLFKSAKDLSK